MGYGGLLGLICDGVVDCQIRTGENGQVVIQPACGRASSVAREYQWRLTPGWCSPHSSSKTRKFPEIEAIALHNELGHNHSGPAGQCSKDAGGRNCIRYLVLSFAVVCKAVR